MQDASESTGRLVPPRPNPGPEPFEEPGGAELWVAGLATGLAVLFVFVWINRKRRPSRSVASPEVVATTSESASARDALIAQASLAKGVLVARFGESWRAKTTEEIAIDPRVQEAFGAETTASLLMLLRDADRAKFAGASEEKETQGWDGWLPGFLAAAGASSTTIGK